MSSQSDCFKREPFYKGPDPACLHIESKPDPFTSSESRKDIESSKLVFPHRGISKRETLGLLSAKLSATMSSKNVRIVLSLSFVKSKNWFENVDKNWPSEGKDLGPQL